MLKNAVKGMTNYIRAIMDGIGAISLLQKNMCETTCLVVSEVV
jgi:hypothetical protein